MLEKYPQDVRLVFKNFPLRSHQYAGIAAIGALAANEQGKFWEFHDMLYANYNTLNQAKIDEIARDIGLDMNKFNNAKSDPAIVAIVKRDMQEGVDAGVRGTPTIFVNGKLLRNRSIAGFQEVIERVLENTPAK